MVSDVCQEEGLTRAAATPRSTNGSNQLLKDTNISFLSITVSWPHAAHWLPFSSARTHVHLCLPLHSCCRSKHARARTETPDLPASVASVSAEAAEQTRGDTCAHGAATTDQVSPCVRAHTHTHIHALGITEAAGASRYFH